MSSLCVSVLDKLDDFLSMSSEWNQLLSESRSGSFFLTWEWLFSWAECFIDKNRSLFILVFHDDKDLIGIAPLYIEKKRIGPFPLREIFFLGVPQAASDYLTVITKKGREEDVANSFYDYLTIGEGAKVWDLAVLAGFPADNLFLFHLMHRINIEGKYAEFIANAYCPVVGLPASKAEVHPQLSTSWSKKVKQNIRVINREQDVIHEVIQGEAVALKLPDFFRHYEEKGGWVASTVQPVIQRLVEHSTGDLPVQIDLLSISGQLVAGFLHFKYQDTLSLYLMAVDKKYNPKVSIGNYLVGQSIDNAIDSGYSVYDFLRGAESYKLRWATGGKNMVQLTFWHKRPVALIAALYKLFRYVGKLVLR